jgi:tRNA pseudouridine55 synthase
MENATPPPAWDFKSGEVLFFNKPLKWSSFFLVKKVRRLIGKEKVGHAGTLDPLATGLMILCTGKKTKTIDSYMGMDKEYVMTLCIGATTPSLDSEFPPENLRDASALTREALEALLPQFLGEQQQMPPMYSAIKVDGKRAYAAARKGQTVELKPRTIHIRELELLEFHPAEAGGQAAATFRVACSKGTYVRSLAADMGAALGLGAYLTALQRTRIGPHHLANAWEFEQFSALLAPEGSPGT